MSGQGNTHFFANWAKERLDEMDANADVTLRQRR